MGFKEDAKVIIGIILLVIVVATIMIYGMAKFLEWDDQRSAERQQKWHDMTHNLEGECKGTRIGGDEERCCQGCIWAEKRYAMWEADYSSWDGDIKKAVCFCLEDTNEVTALYRI